MGIPLTKLKQQDIDFYRKYQENYYSDKNYPIHNKHILTIGDVVKIGDNLCHDNGHVDEEGIVSSLAGLNYYVYVLSYDKRNKRYWPCGFNEKDLTKIDKNIYENKELYNAFEDYLLKICFNLCSDNFKIEYYKRHKKEGNIIFLSWINNKIKRVTYWFDFTYYKLKNNNSNRKGDHYGEM